MFLMRKFRRWPGLALLVLCLISAAGCSRRVALNGSPAAHDSDTRDLPFHSDAEAVSPDAARPGVPNPHEAISKGGVPFNSPDPGLLPPGTLLTVRLEGSLTGSRATIGKPFHGRVEEPVVVDGRTVIPRDAEVKGRVESARLPKPDGHGGYLRLTLDSIHVDDKEVPLVTSSLFARGVLVDADDSGTAARPSPDRKSAIRLKKGRPLTFRLISRLDVGSSAEEEKPQSGVARH